MKSMITLYTFEPFDHKSLKPVMDRTITNYNLLESETKE